MTENAWSALTSRQCGVVSVAQAVRHLSRSTVRWRLQDGLWSRPHPRVIVTHNGPLRRTEWVWVSALAAPPGSALSGPTVLTLAGMRWRDLDEHIHLTVRRAQRRPELPGLVVHWSDCLDGALDRRPGPPRTTVPRGVVDSAAWCPGDRSARGLILAAVQQGLAAPVELLDSLGTRGPCGRHALIKQTVNDAAGGIDSVPEAEFAGLIRRGGLPEPQRQRLLRHSDGRYYLDADWSSYRVGAEVQGSHHNAIDVWDADLDRHNEISAGDRVLLHFSSYAVRHRGARVADLLTRTLQARGWRG